MTESSACGAVVRVDRRRGNEVLAEAARDCVALRNGLALADWVGAGRPVTAKHVLRPADAPRAGQVLGIVVPERLRSAADLPGLHYPWTATLGAGLLSISGDHAMAGHLLPGWYSIVGDEMLDAWLRGLAAVLADTFADDGDGKQSLEIGRLALSVLAADPPSTGQDLLTAIAHAVIGSNCRLHELFWHGSARETRQR